MAKQPRSPVPEKKKSKYNIYRKRLRQNFRHLTEIHRTKQKEIVRRGHIRTFNPLQNTHYWHTENDSRNTSLFDVFLEGIFYKNPVVFHALGVAPIIGAGTTLKNGLALAILTFILLFPINLLTSFFGRNFKPPQRLVLYALSAALLLIPASSFLQYYYPNILSSLGIFLPLVSVSALISVRAEVYAMRNTPLKTAIDSFATGIGFAFVICLVSAIRELLSTGSINGIELIDNLQFPAASMAFFGFFVVGLIAAGLRMLRNNMIIKHNVYEKKDELKKGGWTE